MATQERSHRILIASNPVGALIVSNEQSSSVNFVQHCLLSYPHDSRSIEPVDRITLSGIFSSHLDRAATLRFSRISPMFN